MDYMSYEIMGFRLRCEVITSTHFIFLQILWIYK